jgi:hypothetical protein
MNKKNLILGGVLVFLIIVAWAYQGPFKDYQAKAGQIKNIFSGLNLDNVDRMEISRNGKTDTFLKSGDKWKIDGTKDFFMDSALASGIRDSLTNAKTAEMALVSENAQKKIDFRTDDSGIEVKLISGKNTLYDFIVGNNTPDYQGSYLSQKGSDKTYSIKATLNQTFYNDNWYDKTIFAGDKTKLAKIRFQYPGSGFTIEKVIPQNSSASSSAGAADVWKGTAPKAFSVSTSKIDGILDVMSNLTAAEIPAQTFAGTGLEKNSIIVEATGDGVSNTLMVGDAKKTDSKTDAKLFYAKRGDSDNIYLITETQRNDLVKKMQDLK